ncbi:methyltransferase, FxLD system [Streptosporangium subroseum]|uniref:methyltransferase, FxLD system n=1 Tax=Streptosporangium subroseum TaxID=106412 RepID=UPI003085B8C0|nr:methyltransferase, FxLD system [Streptosporangium subroseum]
MTNATADHAAELRDQLADKLVSAGHITSAQVEAAFRAVPRHEFVPAGTSLEVAYNADESVAIKKDERGVLISSTSAPFLQARMIEQAKIMPGMSIMEIGSGGYNAALVAEIVGPDGRVVSVDIDQDVTDRAGAALEATGYGSRVRVILADAENSVPENGPFDAIIVTVGSWDIPPVWLDQLALDGVIVVPLRMNGVTRSVAFRREAGHLVSTSTEVCGFVPIQGEGEHPDQIFRLPDADGHHIELRFDDGAPEDPSLLDDALATERTEVWSGITIQNGVPFADLHLWFACFLPGFCKVAAEEGTALARERGTWFPFAAVRGDSFAYLVVRPIGTGVEFGARAYGAHGEEAATAMVEQIQAWDHRARSGPAPQIAFWPTGSDPQISDRAAALTKAHGLVTISWPAMS